MTPIQPELDRTPAGDNPVAGDSHHPSGKASAAERPAAERPAAERPGAESLAAEGLDEVLVAYLDGELSPEESEAIDKRLAGDEEYRSRLRELQRAWDMLDLVPRVSVQEEFTRSTVEMIALTAAAEARRSGSSRRRRRRLWQAAAAAAIVAIGLGAYFAAAWTIDRPNRQLLADLPLLVDLNLYRSAESTEFLRELDRRALFTDDQPESEPIEKTSAIASPTPSPAHLTSPLAALTLTSSDSARRQALRTLPTAELDSLRRKKTQFDSLEAAEQERLRLLHREIVASPSAPTYRKLMERYNDWLKTISSSDRATLRDLSGVAKVDRVDQLLDAQQAERFAQLLEGGLAKEDLDKISAWIDAYLDEHESELLATLPGDLRRRLEAGDEAARRRMLALALFRAGGPRPLRLPRFKVERLAGLTQSLSPEAQNAWAKTDEADRPQLAQRWIAAAIWSKGPPVSEKQLRETYKMLDASEREWLERLPPDRMTAELRRLYYRRHFQRENRSLFPERREFQRGLPNEIGPPREAPGRPKNVRPGEANQR
jgi:hypothetical protein